MTDEFRHWRVRINSRDQIFSCTTSLLPLLWTIIINPNSQLFTLLIPILKMFYLKYSVKFLLRILDQKKMAISVKTELQLKFGYLLYIEVSLIYGVRKGPNIHVSWPGNLKSNKCSPCTHYTTEEHRHYNYNKYINSGNGRMKTIPKSHMLWHSEVPQGRY